MSAFQRLIERKQVADILEGWYRSLEVTHDLDPYITKERLQNAKAYYKRLGLKTGDVNPNYDTFHPHFHCLLAVKSSYFSGQRYIKQAEWARLWKESLRIDYDPSVDVRRVKEDKAGAIAEVAKYAAKAGDYIIPDDWELTIETVKLLDKALHKRRLIAYGGVFKEIHKKLHLDSEEDGDLVHVDGERPEKPQGRVVHFLWYSGYRQYKSETQGF